MSRSEEPTDDGPESGVPNEAGEGPTWRIERERHLEEWAALLGSRPEE